MLRDRQNSFSVGLDLIAIKYSTTFSLHVHCVSKKQTPIALAMGHL